MRKLTFGVAISFDYYIARLRTAGIARLDGSDYLLSDHVPPGIKIRSRRANVACRTCNADRPIYTI